MGGNLLGQEGTMGQEGKSAIQENTLMIEINQEGFCVRANQSLTSLTGFRQEEILGKKFKDFLVIDAEKLRDIEQRISEQTDNLINFEASFRQKSGKHLVLGWILNWSEEQNVLQCFGHILHDSAQKYIKENKELRLLNTLNECIRKNKEPEEIFDGLCKIVVKDGNYPLVWIAKVNPTHLEVWYRESEVYIAQNEFKRSPLLSYIFDNYISKQAELEREVLEFPAEKHNQWFPEGRPALAKMMLAPLELEENSIWLFAVGTGDPMGFDDHERAVLDEITNNVAEALRQIQIEAKTISTETSLKKYIQELNLLNEVNNQILVQNNETELISNVLDILVQKGGYKLAWLLFFEKDNERKKIHTPSYFAGETEYAKTLSFDLTDPTILRGPTATSILTRKTIIMGSSQEDPDFIVWKERAKKHGLNSSVSLYLDIEGQEKGILCIYSVKKNMFDNKEVIILERIALNLSFAISQLRSNRLKTAYKTELANIRKKLQEYELILDKTMLVSRLNSAGIILSNNTRFSHYFFSEGNNSIGKMHPLLIEDGKQNELWNKLNQQLNEGSDYFEELTSLKKGDNDNAVKLLVFPVKNEEGILYEYLALCIPTHGQLSEQVPISIDESNLQLLKDLKQIASLEISHELHKLESIVELAQELDVVDEDLKEIFSSSKEVFKKTDSAVRKLAEKITKQLAAENVSAGKPSKYQQIFVLEDDHLSAKICVKLLNKYFDKNQLISFANVQEALAYLVQTEDTGGNLFLLSTQLKDEGTIDFLAHYEKHAFKSPLVLLSNNPESDKNSLNARHKGVKNVIEKPLNARLAEAIYTGELIHGSTNK